MKPYSDFFKNVGQLGNISPQCKMCVKLRQQSRAGRAIREKAHLKSAYGISREQLVQMFENQEGLCAICSQPMCLCVTSRDEGTVCLTRACVDHCHKTGKIRGLIHKRCNVALGIFKDSPTILGNAAQYLEQANVS